VPPAFRLPAALLLALFTLLPSLFSAPAPLSITALGAVGDGTTVNTRAIQAAIDQLHASGGGTVVVPLGVFVSGALDFKPGVNLHLDKDAVLRASTDMANFPPRPTRIEGHTEPAFTPALINADGCDGLRIDGDGTLDGAGRPIWDQFWKSIKADKRFKNLDLPRARLALIENSRNVVVEGVTFKDSQYWNLHLYRCQNVLVRDARFLVPDDYRQAPSTDGIDIDSCQDVTVQGCTFSVTDDCIAAKGSKGPFALDDKASPPVERVHITGCTFRRGGGDFTCGSEATVVRDILIENNRITGPMPVLLCKLRTDTPQTYENITVRNITVSNAGVTVLKIAPWKQYADLKGQPAPHSVVKAITFSGIKGTVKTLASVRPNKGQTTIEDIAFRDIDLHARDAKPGISGATRVTFENVLLNGQPYPAAPNAPTSAN